VKPKDEPTPGFAAHVHILSMCLDDMFYNGQAQACAAYRAAAAAVSPVEIVQKMRGKCSSAMPGPLSEISIYTRCRPFHNSRLW